MPLALYTLLDLVEQFLPGMLARADGAILTAQGASTVRGQPNMSGPGPAQAAQRNYLQSLHAEVAGKGIYVGMLYIGAIIENSAFHTRTTTLDGVGARGWGPTVSPGHLAELLWNMHNAKGPAEASYPQGHPQPLRQGVPHKQAPPRGATGYGTRKVKAISVVCRAVTVTCLVFEHRPDAPDESEHAA
jgi:hypothetical protein